MGLAVCDILAKPVDSKLFQRDTTMLDRLSYMPGGDAFNVASGAAALGIDTALIARIGDDPSGQLLMSSARDRGINSNYIITDKSSSTATSLVLISSSGERHFAYSQGVNRNLTASDFPDDLWKKARHLHIGSAMLLDGLDGDGLSYLFEKAHSFKVSTSMDVAHDPDGLWMRKIERALYHCDLFMPSLQEAQEITGACTPHEIANKLSHFPIKVLIIKLGSEGCFIKHGADSFTLPILPGSTVVDTTGAGDCFVSVFLACYLKGYPVSDAAVYASAGASLCIKQMGAACGFKGFEELKQAAAAYQTVNIGR